MSRFEGNRFPMTPVRFSCCSFSEMNMGIIDSDMMDMYFTDKQRPNRKGHTNVTHFYQVRPCKATRVTDSDLFKVYAKMMNERPMNISLYKEMPTRMIVYKLVQISFIIVRVYDFC